MKSIDVHELKAWREEGKAHQLIDLREDFEVETGHLGGTHIRMGDILSRAEEIRRDVPVILQCRSGGRSAAVLTALEEKFEGVLQALEGQPGHVRTILYRQVRNPRSYAIFSEWESREGFSTFVGSELFRRVTDWGRDQILEGRPRHEIYGPEGTA